MMTDAESVHELVLDGGGHGSKDHRVVSIERDSGLRWGGRSEPLWVGWLPRPSEEVTCLVRMEDEPVSQRGAGMLCHRPEEAKRKHLKGAWCQRSWGPLLSYQCLCTSEI